MRHQQVDPSITGEDFEGLHQALHWRTITIIIQLILPAAVALLLLGYVALPENAPERVLLLIGGVAAISLTAVARLMSALQFVGAPGAIPGSPFRIGMVLAEAATGALCVLAFIHPTLLLMLVLLFFVLFSDLLSLFACVYLCAHLELDDLRKNAMELVFLISTTVILLLFRIALPEILTLPWQMELFLGLLIGTGAVLFIFGYLGFLFQLRGELSKLAAQQAPANGSEPITDEEEEEI